MSRVVSLSRLALSVAVILAAAQPSLAATPQQVLGSIQDAAKAAGGFQGFSAARGEQFFKAKHGNEWSCSSCHTDNPATAGKHAKTGKAIAPMAPAANAERFTDQAKVEKWFKRNCNDVVGRACTAQEQGDILTYLLAVKG